MPGRLSVLLHRCLSSCFIDAVFIIAKKWKQSRCPSMGEWIVKMSYIHTVKFYLAVKQKEIVKMSGNWVELETILNDSNLGPCYLKYMDSLIQMSVCLLFSACSWLHLSALLNLWSHVYFSVRSKYFIFYCNLPLLVFFQSMKMSHSPVRYLLMCATSGWSSPILRKLVGINIFRVIT